MAQEFTIKSPDIESKINQLLPSQGGFEPGVDFTASTMVIPIVDLTETAEGSNLRQDLQSSFSHKSITFHDISNTTTDMVTTTGYYRVYGQMTSLTLGTSVTLKIFVNDGTTDKTLVDPKVSNSSANVFTFDFIVKLEAGDTLKGETSNTTTRITCITRQIADLQGNLTNP